MLFKCMQKSTYSSNAWIYKKLHSTNYKFNFKILIQFFQRTVIQLKRCWDKIKRTRKKDLAREMRERTATGGGSSHPNTNIIPDVDTVAPHIFAEISTAIDSDTVAVEDLTGMRHE